MRVLVTGSEGSLMQAIIPILINNGHDVIGVDNFQRYGEISRIRNYLFTQGDLKDYEFVLEITRGVDYIFQGAATLYGVLGFHQFPADILGNDVQLHQNILRASLKNKIKKIVYISSSMVYERADRLPNNEIDVDSIGVPFTDYGLSKLVGERLTRAYNSQYGLKFTIWRPFNIITPLEKAENEIGFSHVFSEFLDRLIVKKEFPLRIIGSGEQIRCFTWIDDVAEGIANLSFDPRSDNEIFNIGDTTPTKMLELAELIHKKAIKLGYLPDRDLKVTSIKAPDDDVKVRIPSVDKIHTTFGWKPKINLSLALDYCIDEIASNSLKI